jgi:hypothetical protein
VTFHSHGGQTSPKLPPNCGNASDGARASVLTYHATDPETNPDKKNVRNMPCTL